MRNKLLLLSVVTLSACGGGGTVDPAEIVDEIVDTGPGVDTLKADLIGKRAGHTHIMRVPNPSPIDRNNPPLTFYFRHKIEGLSNIEGIEISESRQEGEIAEIQSQVRLVFPEEDEHFSRDVTFTYRNTPQGWQLVNYQGLDEE